MISIRPKHFMSSTGCCESGGLCGLTHLEGKVATGHPVDVGGELVRVAAVLEREVYSGKRARVCYNEIRTLHRQIHQCLI